MNKLLEMSIAADLFMLQLIASGNENATTLKIPTVLQRLFKDICHKVHANADFLALEKSSDFFNLNFSTEEEQDKVWSYLYDFNNYGQRTFSSPNVYDQSSGHLLTKKLDEFVSSAISELNNPSSQYLFLFHLEELPLEFDGALINKNFKTILGSGVNYVMLWNSENSQPLSIMIEGEKDLELIQQEFINLIYEMAKENAKSKPDFKDESFRFFHPISIDVVSKFGFDDIDFWNEVSNKMAPI
jgi:hypothetical protein